MSDAASWDCPDCCPVPDDKMVAAPTQNAGLVAAIRAIEDDTSLTDQEKAKRRQELLSGVNSSSNSLPEVQQRRSEVLNLLDESLNCSICMQLPDRPVTTPCGHNFCLRCFQKWTDQGKQTCANCRHSIPPKMAREPRINSALVTAIRAAKLMNSNASGGPTKPIQFIHNQNRPDKAFVTDRAKKAGKANACSGKIFVTIPQDHFGPIPPENDLERGQGVLVGETWEDRMECRQWGAHFPHVAGIAGQSDYGAQSVALSGGYEDDEDHGEWFLYTGSGGRDLSGNKRTNKLQSFDQRFEKSNEALRVSCRKGYPVRVVRSHKEKSSSYAPEKGVRYDGVYRIEQCWRKGGKQGFLMCRYLFVRCDNEPAPWTSDTIGDRPRPLPQIKELQDAVDITQRKGTPAWDFDEEKGCWMWKKSPPDTRLQINDESVDEQNNPKRVRRQKKLSVKEKLLKEFSCVICRKVMVMPLTTPCAHNFCKACLEGAFSGQSFTRQRTCEGRRTLRTQKNVMKCPSCKADISDFLQNPQVNREMMNVIESLQRETEEDNLEVDKVTDDQGEETVGLVGEVAAMHRTNSDTKDGTDCAEENLDLQAVNEDNCNANADTLDEIENLEEMTESKVKSPEKQGEDKENCNANAGNFEEEVGNLTEEMRTSIVKSPEKQVKDCIEGVTKNNTNSPGKRKQTSSCVTEMEAGVRTRSKKC